MYEIEDISVTMAEELNEANQTSREDHLGLCKQGTNVDPG